MWLPRRSVIVRASRRFAGLAMLAIAMCVATSCTRGVVAPSSAVSAGADGGATASATNTGNLVQAVRQPEIEVCHALGGGNPYILLTVGERALAAHLGHGDGRVGDAIPGQSGVVFGPDCAAVTVCAAAPGVPGFLGWTTVGVATGSVRMNWGPATGEVTSYVVEVGTTVGGSDVAVIDTGNTQTSYLLTGLVTSVDKYHVRVRAKNPCGVSAPSNEANPRVA